MLRPVHGRNRYCGPAAISTLTGCSTDQAARHYRVLSGKAQCRGMHIRYVKRILQGSGIKLGLRHDYSTMEPRERPTLAWALRNTGPGTYLVSASNHWIVMQIGDGWAKVVDSAPRYTCKTPTSADSAPGHA